MATTTASRPLTLGRTLSRPVGSAAAAGLLALIGLGITIQFPEASPLVASVLVILIGVAGWMFFSERYEWSLAVVMLYIGLADGYLKLSTGSSHITLLRDVLMYAIVSGALVRMAIRRQHLEWPPLSGWVIAWTLVVLVQLANPLNGTLHHSFASLRPQLEWVPLFFFAYALMRSSKRIQAFLLLLLVIAAANGVVGLIQLNLSKEQLATWGPGYHKAIYGESSEEGGVSARGFVDEEGEEHNRPFALGGDAGFGGAMGMITIPAALALLGLARRNSLRFLIALLSIGAVIAVATSASRTAVLGSVVAVFSFAGLSVTSRTGLRTVLALGLALLVGYTAISFLGSNTNQGSFARYNTIKNPSEAVSTAYNYRRNTLEKIPKFMTEIPFGGGFGSNGPAASYPGKNGINRDAESEPTYLLIETGIPGFVVLYGFLLTLLYLSVSKIRKIKDREVRILLTAIAAPLFATFMTGFAGINSATVPHGPYLWFAGGILSYWLVGKGRVLANRPGVKTELGSPLVPEPSG